MLNSHHKTIQTELSDSAGTHHWKLLTPFNIGNMEIANRIMMPAMHLNYHRDFGFADETLVAFYTERAKGRAGLISIGGFAVHPSGAGVFGGILWGLWGDEYIPDLAKVTRSMKSVHPEGMLACQLYHTGRVSPSAITGHQPVGASDKPSRFNSEPIHVLSTDEVVEVENQYVASAVRAITAGFDCVEIFCGVGHLLNQFLSPETNDRTDHYGGSIENRSRIVINIIQSIKAQLPGVPVLARLAGHDFVPGGNTHHEIRKIAKLFEVAGADAFNVTGGWHETKIPQITGEVPTGAYSWLAQNVRSAVSVPVAASNRINDPLVAERLLRQNQADFISMGRPLLADPYLPKKLMEGNLDQVTHCIACNICLDTAWHGPARCLVNPAAGREREFALEPIVSEKKIVVVGGGLGGMMATNTAAERGHKVVLYEGTEHLGGVAAVGGIAPGKAEYKWVYEDLKNKIRSNPGVEVRLSTIATSASIKVDQPDEVIIATGGTPVIPKFPGQENSAIPIYHAHDVLGGNISGPIGNNVIVVGGGSTGCETALFLKEQGSLDAEAVKFLLIHRVLEAEEIRELAMVGQPQRQVTVVQRSDRLAKDLNKSIRWTVLKALDSYNIQICTNSTVQNIDTDSVLLSEGADKEKTIPCDTIIIAAGIVSNNALYQDLQGQFSAGRLHLIGDAAEPRQAVEAIEEATKIAISI
jgi:2,4-dienoyl-CoA reductase (NADPH2)